MFKVNPYAFIVIGLLVRYLRTAGGELSSSIIKSISSLLQSLEKMQFRVTLKATEATDDLINFQQELVGLSKPVQLSLSQKSTLARIMNTLEKVIYAEAQTKELFITTEKRYSIDFLLNQPDKILGTNVYNIIPEISRYDFQEGFRCIAFGLPTAAAFHMLRGTESVLKAFYLKHIKRCREPKPMWANMVQALRKKKTRGTSKVLLDSLEMIRESYRNPTAHPEIIYDIEQVQDLLGVCIDVVNKMAFYLSEGE